MLGRRLRPGTVVAYRGGLGMGKTALPVGLLRSGCAGRVTSPTFTIVNEYDGATPLFHFDMYRLGSSDELFDIGWEDYLTRGGVRCGGSERVDDAMPADPTLGVQGPGARATPPPHSPGREARVRILALETSAKSVSVAVTEKRHTAYFRRTMTGADPQRDADAAAGRNAEDRGLTLDDMDIIAVARAGSFTGIRIGVSAAKGAGVGQGAALLRRIHAGGHGLWRHGLRGRRCGRYGCTAAAGVQRAVPDRKRPRYETMRGQGRGYGAGGGGIGRHAGAKADRGRRRGAAVRLFAESGDRVPAGLSLHRQQSAAGVALVAEHLAAQGLTCSAQELQPVYLRLSQAERERLARGCP